MKHILFVLQVAMLLWLLPPVAVGAAPVFELWVMEEVPVYRSPSVRSEVIAQLGPGDQVRVAPKPQKGFYKVRVFHSGRAQTAYVASQDLRRSQILEKGSKPKTPSIYRSRWSLGFAGVTSYMRQGEATFQMTDGSVYDTTAFESFGVFASVFADVPWSQKWALRPFVTFRQTQFKGTATQRPMVSPFPTSANVLREQSFIGLGLILKRYAAESSNWWYGGGLEFARGQRMTLKLNGVVAPTSSDDIPFFGILFAAAGREWLIPGSNNIYFTPDLRMGSVVTTLPITFYVDVFFALAYRF